MTQDRAQLLITAVDQTRSAFDSIRGNLAKLGNESNRVKDSWRAWAFRCLWPASLP